MDKTSRHGFRQGCLLSPYLFILYSELLSKALHQHGYSVGIAISNWEDKLLHLLYADDILLFVEASSAKQLQLGRSKEWRIFLGYRRVEELEYIGIKLSMRKLTALIFLIS
ncbi:hypothetical protein M5K25_009098 [Dendrobium thyrsiflorum]|uniref:Reverse transcriptase domain-containing protein n=1 Tax=Dendrobium thyrsiflorum TaxID=117978 RepID=A0ABD0V5E7_DENTH